MERSKSTTYNITFTISGVSFSLSKFVRKDPRIANPKVMPHFGSAA